MKSELYEELAKRLQDAGLTGFGKTRMVDSVDLLDASFVIRDLQSRLEQAEKDSKMLDWLESSKTSHGFCHSGYGDYRYYAHQQDGYKTVREVIDAAMQSAKESQ